MAESNDTLLSLSGQELFEQVNKGHVENLLPERGGQKDYAPDGSWLQGKRLEKYQQGLLQVLRLQHVEAQHKLCLGEWHPVLKKIQLLRVTGNIFHYMGHSENGKKVLYPEEGLVLMDMGILEVQYGGVTLSMQQAYSCMLSRNLPLHHYQVYATLTRMGYIIMRHRGISSVTNYERKIRLDQHLTEKELFRGEFAPECNEMKTTKSSDERKRSLSDSNDMKDESNVLYGCNFGDRKKYKKAKLKDGYHKQQDAGGSNKTNISLLTSEERLSISSKSVPSSDAVKLVNWDFTQINFPNLADAESVTVEKPDKSLLPEGEEIDVAVFTRTSFSLVKLKPSYARGHNLEFSQASSHDNEKAKPKNWREFKDAQQSKQIISLAETPAGHLWDGSNKPLVKPCNAKSTAVLLNCLQIIPTCDQDDLVSSSAQPSVIYDAYKPDSQFKKTQPGLPNHRICIRKQQDPVPSLPEVMHLHNYYADGVPIHWAVVDNGVVSFYVFHDFSTPTQMCMG